MSDPAILALPFFDDAHRDFAADVQRWCESALPALVGDDDGGLDATYAQVRALVGALGEAGLLRACVPAAYGGARDALDARSLCLARETLARAAGLADFAFAMQGLGSASITLAGNEAQKRRWLPGVAAGTTIPAFALSEPEAGSDVAATATTAVRDGDGWRLDGTKTWISNGGLADLYVIYARTGEPGRGAKGLSAFVVDAGTPGLDASQRIPVSAPHPLGTLQLRDCRIEADRLLGEPGDGFRIAMSVLDVFRSTVGAAALGFARRACDEALARSRSRRMFGQRLADFQLTQVALGDMAVKIDAAALLVHRAAWLKDVAKARVTREASMAKLFATESAQQVVDAAVQLHGGLGVVHGSTVERLYREVRALRIYEGASEVLKVIVGAKLLEAAGG